MNKLTDSEIVKALELCFTDNFGDCEGCPLKDKRDDLFSCMRTKQEFTLDLINRQKAEIERLQNRQRTVVAENAITALREKCVEHQDFHKGDDGVFRAYISIEDLDRIVDELEVRSSGLPMHR